MKTPDHADGHREQAEAALKPLLTDRRGFLHRSALVIGAFLAGLGRSELAFGCESMTVVACCMLCCRNDSTCTYRDDRCVAWSCLSGGQAWLCIECYDTAQTRQAAGGNCDPAKGGETWCSNVVCSKAVRKSQDSQESSGWERAWSELDDLGVGCYDPATGDYIMWSEPGTACDIRSPVSSPPDEI